MVVKNCEWDTEGFREFSESIIYDFFYLVANMIKYSLMRAQKGGENEIVINNECMMIN